MGRLSIHLFPAVVMNCYSHAAAYSLYPCGTFERRIMVACDVRDREGRSLKFREKYETRGWRIIHSLTDLYHESLKTPKHEANMDFFIGQRSVGDGLTWTIPFSDTAEVLRAAFPHKPLPHNIICGRTVRLVDPDGGTASYVDPTSLNSFNFTFNKDLEAFEIRFHVGRASSFVSPSWTEYQNEMCYTLSLQLSRKMEIWFEWLKKNTGHARQYARDYGHDKLLAEWIDASVSKCTCSTVGIKNACPVSAVMRIVPDGEL